MFRIQKSPSSSNNPTDQSSTLGGPVYAINQGAPASSPTLEGLKVQSKLQALANVAQNLNELSDRLTGQVNEIETAINKLNLGVHADVDAETSAVDDCGAALVVRLGYNKISGKWGFTIDQFIDQDPENTYNVWAFKDAPRDLRLKVVERIPQLMDELVATSTKLASEINAKIELAKHLIANLPQPSPTGSKQ